MNQLLEYENIKIEDMIYEINGKQVMFDSDLAKLYNVETKRINEAVKNNPLKFPERFCFKVDEYTFNILKSKISTSKVRGGSRKGHNVFTEQGVAMLSTVLKSNIAITVSINIMDAFVNMKKYISNSLVEQKYINNIVLEDRERINLLEETLNKFKEKNNHIFFEGQIYDAHSLMIDIINKANKKIVIIDNYIDKNILDILSKIDKKIIVITNKYNNDDYEKYKKQYHNINLQINNSFHDRFIILDDSILYHCGSSFKDLGKKCFEISKIEEKDVLKKLLNKI